MNDQKALDISYMKHALELARRGMGTVAPNPMVGAVIVKDGKIIGEGWHVRPGEPHAEPNAFSSCTEDTTGATVYVTLEPCCHTKKRTPPCTSLLVTKNLKRVVIATLDPNPQVAGNGVKILEDAGIEVTVGVLEKESQKLNEIFFKNIITKTPFINLKLAQTLDGKISTFKGDSKWITDEKARAVVHQFRLQYDAVMVGRNTLNNDDPSLTIRMGVESKGKVPFRIVVGSVDKLDLSSKLFTDEHKDKTIVLTTCENNIEGIKVVKVNKVGDRLDIKEALSKLGEMGITSILVEGGGTLASSFIENELADKLSIFVAPKILGNGVNYLNRETELMNEAITFKQTYIHTLGNQVMFELYPQWN